MQKRKEMKGKDSADGVYIVSAHTCFTCMYAHCSTAGRAHADGRQQQGLDVISLRTTLPLWAACLWLYHPVPECLC